MVVDGPERMFGSGDTGEVVARAAHGRPVQAAQGADSGQGSAERTAARRGRGATPAPRTPGARTAARGGAGPHGPSIAATGSCRPTRRPSPRRRARPHRPPRLPPPLQFAPPWRPRGYYRAYTSTENWGGENLGEESDGTR